MSKELTLWAHVAAQKVGTPLMLFLATGLGLLWIVYGLTKGYSENWHLWMDIPATLLPFLMLFLLQTSQNRDTQAMQMKLDELLIAVQDTDERVVDLEDAPESFMEEKRSEQQRD